MIKVDYGQFDFQHDDDTWITGLLVPASTLTAANKQLERPAQSPVHRELLKLSAQQEKLLGTWRLETIKYTLRVTIHSERTIFFSVQSRAEYELPYLGYEFGKGFGAGTWRLRGATFFLDRTQYVEGRPGRGNRWQEYNAKLLQAKIRTITKDKVVFSDGVMMHRETKPLESFRFHQHHPWYAMPPEKWSW